jgi:hypothetical protein
LEERALKALGWCLFFRASFVVLVVSEREYIHTFDIPIEIRNIPARKTLSAEIVPTAEVRFRGTGRALFQSLLLKPLSNFKLVIDLDRIKTEYDFDLNIYLKITLIKLLSQMVLIFNLLALFNLILFILHSMTMLCWQFQFVSMCR